jgi:hypothetical protein
MVLMRPGAMGDSPKLPRARSVRQSQIHETTSLGVL